MVSLIYNIIFLSCLILSRIFSKTSFLAALFLGYSLLRDADMVRFETRSEGEGYEGYLSLDDVSFDFLFSRLFHFWFPDFDLLFRCMTSELNETTRNSMVSITTQLAATNMLTILSRELKMKVSFIATSSVVSSAIFV